MPNKYEKPKNPNKSSGNSLDRFLRNLDKQAKRQTGREHGDGRGSEKQRRRG